MCAPASCIIGADRQGKAEARSGAPIMPVMSTCAMQAPGGSLPRMTPEDLVEIELIKRLKYRYARCLDLKLWDDIAECFTPDAVAAYSGGGYTFEGRDAIVEFLRRSMGSETFHSSHKMHHPEIEITGPGAARAVWALDDVVIDTQWEITIRGCSFYDDEYVRRDGAWRIARTGY